jgi:hypothetical protein
MFILGRIVARTGVAVWRHRFIWLCATFVVAAFGLIELTYARPAVATDDCADLAMAAVSRSDDDTARAAYDCLVPAARFTTEDQWINSLHNSALTRGRVTRVAEQHTDDGGQIIFFTVDAGSANEGYIVYLDAQGKIVRVE